LRLGFGLSRAAIDVGMKLFGEQAIGRADVRVGAIAVEAERGVMVGFGGLAPAGA
jgi:hypothetical protein